MIIWYSDDIKSGINGGASICNSEIEDGGVLDQTDNSLLKFAVSLKDNYNVPLELGLRVEDASLWRNVLDLHRNVNDEGSKLKFIEQTLNDFHSFEEGKPSAVMQVTLKGKPCSIQVSPDDNVSVIADKFIDENKLKPEIKPRIETELLKTQLDACLIYETKLRKSLAETRGCANERIHLEERCYAAEQTTVKLIESLSNINDVSLQVKSKLADLQKVADEKAQAADRLTVLLEKEHYEAMNQRDLNRNLQSQMEQLIMDCNILRRKLSDSESNSNNFNRRETTLNVQLQSVKQINSNMQLENRTLNDKLQILDGKYKDAMQKYQLAVMTGKRAAERIRSAPGSKSSHAAGEEDRSEGESEDMKLLKSKFEEKLKVLRSQVVAHDELKSNLQKRLDDSINANNNAANLLRKSEEESIRLRNELKELKTKVNSSYSSPNKLSLALENENKTLRQQLITYKGDMKKIKKQLDEVEESAIHAIQHIVMDISKRCSECWQSQNGYEEIQQFLTSILASVAKPDNNEESTDYIHSNNYEAPVVDEDGDDELDSHDNVNRTAMEFQSPLNMTAKGSAQEQSKLLQDFSKREVLYDLITPIVEDRLFRTVYFKYVSDISGGLNITRMGRFAKEFGIVNSNLPGGTVITSAHKPPYLTSGEVDMIYLNSCKLEDGVTESGTISAWEEHMGLLSSSNALNGGKDRKLSPFNVRHAGDRIGGPSGNESRSINGKGHISVHQLTISQFVTCMRAVATRLYASLIEQQTGTILECLPPRQKEVATAAALEVLLKKKILPVAETLGLVPWPLILLDQTLTSINNSINVNNILNSRLDMIIQLYQRYAVDIVIVLPHLLSSSHQMLVEEMVDAIRSPQQQLNLSRKSSDRFNSPLAHHNPHHQQKTVTVQAIPYKALSQLAHDFGIVPSLLKEGEYFCQFEEVTLWCKTDLHLMLSALSTDLQSKCTLFQEEMEWRNTQMRIREQINKSSALNVNNLSATAQSGSTIKGTPVSSDLSQSGSQQVLGFASFVVFLSSIALQVYDLNDLLLISYCINY